MLWLPIAIAAFLLGTYYLLCAFLPAIRLGDGEWDYHLAPTIIIWMLPARPKALQDRPVSRRSFLLTGGGFFAIGLSWMLNIAGYLGDDFPGYVFFVALLASALAIFLDYLEAPPKDTNKDKSVGGLL